MNSVKMYGIMVLYNKFLMDSVTFQSLCNQAITLVICDNSNDLEMGKKNQEYAGSKGLAYCPMRGNKGLSVAYNCGLDYLKEHFDVKHDDRIILLDDDTNIPNEYLTLISGEEYQKMPILLPIVQDELGIMSPVQMKNRVAKRFTSEDLMNKCPASQLSGINSAMAVQAWIFEKYRYNEEMFLDYIDHKFIIEMRQQNIYPHVLDVKLWQHFSAVKDTREAARKRFAMQKKDLRIFYKNRPMEYAFVVLKKHLKLVIKHKDITMLFC